MTMSSKASLYVPAHMCLCVFADIPPFFFAGELPKELGKLVNLITLRLDGNGFQGELYVPSYNTSTQSTDDVMFAQVPCPRNSGTLSV